MVSFSERCIHFIGKSYRERGGENRERKRDLLCVDSLFKWPQNWVGLDKVEPGAPLG